MLELRSVEENSSLREILENRRIGADCALFHLCLGRFAAHAGKLSCLRSHAAVIVHHLNERSIVFSSDAGIVFTECRCDMNDTGTVGHGYIIVAVYKECLLVLLLHGIRGALIERLVFLALQLDTLHLFENLIRLLALFLCQRTENLVQKRLCHVIGESVGSLNLRVGLFRIYTERNVGRKSPRGGSPCEEVCVLTGDLKADDGGFLL